MPIEEIMETLNEAVMAGKVKYIGISNFTSRVFSSSNVQECIPPLESPKPIHPKQILDTFKSEFPKVWQEK